MRNAEVVIPVTRRSPGPWDPGPGSGARPPRRRHMRIPGSGADTPPATGGRESTLSADLHVTGTISGQDLDVLGHFEGELRLAGRLRTGGASRVKAIVKAKAVEIEGEFEGEVRADSLRLAPTARARGTFVAKRLVIEEGAVFHGAVNREPP